MVDTANNRPARCLDLTRLVSRAGRGQLTGIDRVERAYLRQLLHEPIALYSLIKLRRRFYLLDEAATRQFGEILLNTCNRDCYRSHFPRARNPWTRLTLRLRVFRLANARTDAAGLSDVLKRHLPRGTAYLNVGHSNLNTTVFDAVHKVADATAAVMIHDAIPLDFPQYQRAGTAKIFENKLRAIAATADIIIFNSYATRRDVERHIERWYSRTPPSVVAHLGVEAAAPDTANIPTELDIRNPYFVTIGTIEPRKNHALLLDIWETLARKPNPPRLFVIGARGWNNIDVFRRLNDRPASVTELNNLPDNAVCGLLDGATALLMPSFAEGFGLPAAEAARLGVPVICSDLLVFREVLGDYPVYVDPRDIYLWEQAIMTLAKDRRGAGNMTKSSAAHASLPTWQDHFNLVLKVT